MTGPGSNSQNLTNMYLSNRAHVHLSNKDHKSESMNKNNNQHFESAFLTKCVLLLYEPIETGFSIVLQEHEYVVNFDFSGSSTFQQC